MPGDASAKADKPTVSRGNRGSVVPTVDSLDGVWRMSNVVSGREAVPQRYARLTMSISNSSGLAARRRTQTGNRVMRHQALGGTSLT